MLETVMRDILTIILWPRSDPRSKVRAKIESVRSAVGFQPCRIAARMPLLAVTNETANDSPCLSLPRIVYARPYSLYQYHTRYIVIVYPYNLIAKIARRQGNTSIATSTACCVRTDAAATPT